MNTEPELPKQASVPVTPRRVEEVRAPRRGWGRAFAALFWMLVGLGGGIFLGSGGLLDAWFPALRDTPDSVKLAVEVTELSERVDTVRRDLEVKDRDLATARREASAARQRAEFLDRYLAYEQGRNEASRARLADAMCGLVRQAETARATFVRSPLVLREDQIRAGLRAEVESLLLQNEVTPEQLARARRKPAGVIAPSMVTQFNVLQVQRAAQARRQIEREAQEAVAAVLRKAQSTTIVTSVRFADGPELGVPEDVALTMHSMRDCKPG